MITLAASLSLPSNFKGKLLKRVLCVYIPLQNQETIQPFQEYLASADGPAVRNNSNPLAIYVTLEYFLEVIRMAPLISRNTKLSVALNLELLSELPHINL